MIYEVNIRSVHPHGRYGKESFRRLFIDAKSKKDAVEKTKKEMLRTTYQQFFIVTDLLTYKFEIMPRRKINEIGIELFLSDEEVKTKMKEYIKNDIFQNVEIIATKEGDKWKNQTKYF